MVKAGCAGAEYHLVGALPYSKPTVCVRVIRQIRPLLSVGPGFHENLKIQPLNQNLNNHWVTGARIERAKKAS